MQLEIFFCWFYHFLGPKNGISLQEHDFLNFLHFWNSLVFQLIFDNFSKFKACIKKFWAADIDLITFLYEQDPYCFI